jgi:hypothetical protein
LFRCADRDDEVSWRVSQGLHDDVDLLHSSPVPAAESLTRSGSTTGSAGTP